MVKDPQIFLEQIKDFCDKITLHTQGKTLADFKSDELLQYAIIKILEMIGEACNKLETDFHSTHPDIPWRSIIGMRNRTVHDYWDINLPIVWKTVTTRVPELRDQIAKLIDSK